MKKTRLFLMIVSLFLVLVTAVHLSGCAVVEAKDLMEGIAPASVDAEEITDDQNASVTDFAIRLLQATEKEGENTLLSPLSVLCALAMTQNGAKGETLEQMEEVLGMNVGELNLYLYSYVTNLPQGEKYKLSLANSIWFTEDGRFAVNPEFLQTNADYYGADLYQAPFDQRTCREINAWVKAKTDGMIPHILDQIPPDALMYLVNALAFEAEWEEVYTKHQVRDGEFTKEDGTKQRVTFMNGSEYTYLEDANATGFVKRYKDGKYGFVALLPKEGVSVSEYIASLDGTSLHALLANPQYTTVNTSIPKFETACDLEMSEILRSMGMTAAFDSDNADFSGLGSYTDGNIYIGRVLHKTFLSVGEKGTRAGAATVIEMVGESCAPQEPKRVCLDRPFVYMLVDLENNVPFFIGTAMNVN